MIVSEFTKFKSGIIATKVVMQSWLGNSYQREGRPSKQCPGIPPQACSRPRRWRSGCVRLPSPLRSHPRCSPLCEGTK